MEMKDRIASLGENEVIKMLLTLGATLSAPMDSPTKGKRMFPAIDGGTFRWQEFGDADPQQIAEHPIFDTAESFVEYVNEFKNQDSAISQIFADAGDGKKPTFIACLDWHAPGKARKRSHNAQFSPVLDPFWQAWHAVHGVPMNQTDFARFIEEHAPEFLARGDYPDAATMLEIATDFDVKVDYTFKSKKNLQNGYVELEVKETINGSDVSKAVKIPKQVLISIPVFLGETKQEILVNLRWSARPATPLQFAFEIYRIEDVYNEAFLLVADRIGKDTSLKPKMGRPKLAASR